MNKKTKRAIGEARQKAHRAASIASGLKAQAKDREVRTAKAKRSKEDLERKNAKKAINGMVAPEPKDFEGIDD